MDLTTISKDKLKREIKKIRASGLFDANYYLAMNPDVKEAGLDPVRHFVAKGWREGRNPSAFFDIYDYLKCHPEVVWSGANPFLDYMKRWKGEGLRPSRSFRTVYGAEKGTDLKDMAKRFGLKLNKRPGFVGRTEKYEEIVFPRTSKPLVSIIIYAHNNFLLTYFCLKSVFDNTANLSYEVILCDDASTDATRYIRRFAKNLKVVRNGRMRGRPFSYDRIAGHIKGGYIALLDNGMRPRKNWLSNMVSLAQADSRTGMVGAKLLNTDGKLLEAGCIIFNDATAWNYGKNSDHSLSEYNYVKEVDYVSSACCLMRKDLWKKTGWSGRRYSSAYFKDADMAFETRRRGCKVFYQPQAEAVFYGSLSQDMEGADNYKHKVVNKAKFIKKWGRVLKKNHAAAGRSLFLARDRSLKKKTVVVMDSYDQIPAAQTAQRARLNI